MREHVPRCRPIMAIFIRHMLLVLLTFPQIRKPVLEADYP